MWASAGLQTNPVTDFVLADTGPLTDSGSGRLFIVIAATATVICVLEHRNSTNSSNLNSQVFGVESFGVYDTEIPGIDWADSERFRLRLYTGLTGSCQASLFFLPG